MGIGSSKVIDIIWFDENINNSENQKYLKQLKPLVRSFSTYANLEKGFNDFYTTKFISIFTIVSGKLWGKFFQMFKENINKIINIPYVVIFTSEKFKNILLQNKPDEEHILSYDTLNGICDTFYNPEGIVSSFNELKDKILLFKQGVEFKIKKRTIDKYNFEGVLTFEYLQNEEDLLAPALYKEIITNEEIKEEEKKNLINYFLSFKNNNLDNLFLNLKYFKNIPIEILSKYSARAYTYETDFYKILNCDLMKSQMNDNYKTFIKLFYNGIEVKSFSSFTGKLLYRGSRINKREIEKIIDYKKNGKLNNIVVFSKAFLSFSEIESKALTFLGKSDDIFLGILFVLENYNNYKHESNADIHVLSAFNNEREILFFPGSSFIIKEINYINNNSVKIILNYNGKFKEKFNLIYENKKKLNDLIKTNTITKSIGGKELEFIKGGQYLIIERISNLKQNNKYITNIMKAKNLDNNELIYIKEIPLFEAKFFSQLAFLLKELKDTNNVCSLKETFSINDSFYMVVEIYDDYLSNYLKKIKPKGLPANLIKKIMLQLKKVFLSLQSLFGKRKIVPSNILIKYTNEKKNNFDVYLNEDGILQKNIYDFTLYYIHSDIISDFIKKNDIFMINDHQKKIKNELFNIGIFLYELYFNEIPLPFEMESDYRLYQDIFFNKKTIYNLNYDPIKYPLIKECEDIKNYNDKRFKNVEKFMERNNIKFPDIHDQEFLKKSKEIAALINANFEKPKEEISLKSCFLREIENRRNNWIKKINLEFSEKKESIYDKLLFDLIYKLIGNNNEENITNYEDFFNHPFFHQYNY